LIIRLSKSISIVARYIHKRTNSPYWQFCLRVPTDLRDRYRSPWLRESLKTTDEREAMRRADKLVASHEATFASMRGNTELTPADTHRAAQALASELGPWDIAVDYFSEKFDRHADKSGLFGHQRAAEMIKDSDYLSPVELKALEMLRDGKSKAPKLSAALTAYLKNHKNAGKKRFVEQATRDWGRLVSTAGDIAIADLARQHARMYVEHCTALGMRTTAVRRCINSVRAILNFGIKELDIRGALNPFSDISIPNEDTDAKKVKTPSPSELHAILQKFASDSTDPGLIILMQMGLGTRVGEVSGLKVADVRLDADIPHVFLQVNEERSLKTKQSKRKTPLVGFALEAAKTAVKKAGKNPSLFARYAKENGNTNASAAVNKRLKSWAIGSHGFRHALKDLLREAGCPANIQEEIQGHASGKIAENYGEGHSLRMKAEWMAKAYTLIKPAKASETAAESAVLA
jgi:integrase